MITISGILSGRIRSPHSKGGGAGGPRPWSYPLGGPPLGPDEGGPAPVHTSTPKEPSVGPPGDHGTRNMSGILWPIMALLLLVAVAGPCLTFYMLIKVRNTKRIKFF